MAWTCDVSIEEKVKQDCYNRGYEQGRKNPCDEIVAYIEELQNQVKEYQDKIEQGTLIEIEPNLIGETIIGIHHFTDGTYHLDLDENLVIGFNKDEVVTWNNSHGYNDYFQKDLIFLDNEKGRAEAEKRLKELQNG